MSELKVKILVLDCDKFKLTNHLCNKFGHLYNNECTSSFINIVKDFTSRRISVYLKWIMFAFYLSYALLQGVLYEIVTNIRYSYR